MTPGSGSATYRFDKVNLNIGLIKKCGVYQVRALHGRMHSTGHREWRKGEKRGEDGNAL